MAYIRSEFFRISLQLAENYKLIQNKTRGNENYYLYKNQKKTEKYHAGPHFMNEFKK